MTARDAARKLVEEWGARQYDKPTMDDWERLIDAVLAFAAERGRAERKSRFDVIGAATQDINELRAHLAAAQAEVEWLRGWKDAVIDAAVVSWTLKPEHENDPRAAVNDLLAWTSSVALDPLVSEPAAELHARAEISESRLAAAREAITGRALHAAYCIHLRPYDECAQMHRDGDEEAAERLRAALTAPDAPKETT